MTNGSALVDVLTAAAQGATILTANQRTSRTLLDAYDRRQQQAQAATWRTPDILPWSGFVHRLWTDLLFAGRAGNAVLLNASQERALWERIVGGDSNDSLLNASATAANARQAWLLMREYEIPRREDVFARRTETAAFFRWASRFEYECERNNWIDEASLPALIAPQLGNEKLALRKRILLVGFDHFTPQQQSLINAFTAAGTRCETVPTLRGPADNVCVTAAQDSADEIHASAAWARHRLECHPDAKIGVVSFALEEQRSRIDRAFLEALHPEQLTALSPGRRRCYEISLGQPLAEIPVIASAVLLVKIACIGLSLAEAGSLLRSPFLAGAETETTARAHFDCELRDGRKLELSLTQLREAAWQSRNCPALVAALKAAEREWNAVSARQSPRQWAEAAARMLEAVGWPAGERGLNSAEFQSVEAFTDALSQFGSLDPVEPAMDAPRFFAQLQQCLAEQLFAPEKSVAPIQIMGPLEASGSELDALWILGMHDGVWPSGARPNPFLPLALQLKAEVPHASAAIELSYAETVRDRLLSSAGEVVFSYPKNDGDTVLRASPLLANFLATGAARDVWDVAGTASATWAGTLSGRGAIERFEDDAGPALAEGTLARGGTGALKSQAACPFMAFARWRLGATEPESPEPGLDARQRGVIVHRALEFVWGELRSHSELLRRSTELEALVDACVHQAIDDTDSAGSIEWERNLAELEQGRVRKLILDLLRLEMARAPFTVEPEQERMVPLGGLRFRMKLDRIDRLDDDLGCVLIDYKTGEAKTSSWLTCRPEEPQLPAYAATADDHLVGIAFVKLRAGDVGFAGYSPDPRILPGAGDYWKTAPGKEGRTLEQVVADWRRTIERLAQEHREGRADADPVHGDQTCAKCPVRPLCRIAELRLASPEGDEEESSAE